jgi:hypothetical protein
MGNHLCQRESSYLNGLTFEYKPTEGIRSETFSTGPSVSLPRDNTFFRDLLFVFIETAPENPVLWTGMKGVSAKGRKNLNQMLKRA